LPSSIWVLAWSSLAGQVLHLLQRGSRLDEGALLVSVGIGALLLGYIAAGVVRARTVRLVLAWVVLLLSLVAELVSLASADDPGHLAVLVLSLATTAVGLVALARFRRTDWYAWQRTKPPTREGARIGRLVAIGALVGMLGGVVQPAADGIDVRVRVAGR